MNRENRRALKKVDKKFVSYLSQEIAECERKSAILKNIDPDLSDFWNVQAIKLRLRMYKETETLEKYKELFKHWAKDIVSNEEYANVDDYFKEKYGI